MIAAFLLLSLQVVAPLDTAEALTRGVHLPPSSSWVRAKEAPVARELARIAVDEQRPLLHRVRAIHFLSFAPRAIAFETWASLARDPRREIREEAERALLARRFREASAKQAPPPVRGHRSD